MRMTLSSLRIPEELSNFYEEFAAAHPDRFSSRAEAMRAALEFYRDFHLSASGIERHIVEAPGDTNTAIKRIVLDIPRDHYNTLRSMIDMGRAVSVPEIIRESLRRYTKREIREVAREKEELARATEAVRAHNNEFRMRDSHLTK